MFATKTLPALSTKTFPSVNWRSFTAKTSSIKKCEGGAKAAPSDCETKAALAAGRLIDSNGSKVRVHRPWKPSFAPCQLLNGG
jgi:hypothetical protein